MEREIAAVRKAQRDGNSSQAATFHITGVGRDRVEASLANIKTVTLDPIGILSLGYAAALREGMEPGDLVITRSMWAAGEETCFPSDPCLLSHAQAVVERLQISCCQVVDSVTVYGVATSRAEKRLLAASTSASIANMEDYWVARWAYKQRIPYLSVRSVLDTLSQDVPEFISGLAGKTLPAQAIGVAIQGLARPEKLRSVAKLFREDRLARQSLKEFAAGFLEYMSTQSSYAST